MICQEEIMKNPILTWIPRKKAPQITVCQRFAGVALSHIFFFDSDTASELYLHAGVTLFPFFVY